MYSGCCSTSHSSSGPEVCSDERDLGIVLQHVEERQVAVAIGVLEDPVEIADRLVIVQGEDQAETCDMVGPSGGDPKRRRRTRQSRSGQRAGVTCSTSEPVDAARSAGSAAL